MLKKFSIMLLIILSLFIAGCNNEKGNNLYIGVEGEENEAARLTLMENLYIGLFEYNGTNDVEPILAESFYYDETGKKMFIKINEGFLWSDGSPITVNDVVTGLQNNIRNASDKYSYQYKYLDNKVPENIKVNEEGLLEITLSREFTDFEKVLAMPIFYPVMNSEDFLNGPYSGDFVVEKNSGDKIVLVPRDPEKAISENKTETIVFEYFSDKEKLVKGFQDKSLDILFPKSTLEEVKGEKNTNPGIKLLWLNSRSKVLNNIEARKTIYEDIDKILGIYPKVYRKDTVIEKIELKGNYDFQNNTLDLLVLDSPEELKAGEKIKEQLTKNNNLAIQILAKPLEEYVQELRAGNFDLALEFFEGDYHGKNAYFELFKNPLNNPLNVSGIIEPEINNLQNQVNRIKDSEERELLFQELEKKIIEIVPAIIISEGIEKEIYIQRVKNIVINSIYNYHDYSNVKY